MAMSVERRALGCGLLELARRVSNQHDSTRLVLSYAENQASTAMKRPGPTVGREVQIPRSSKPRPLLCDGGVSRTGPDRLHRRESDGADGPASLRNRLPVPVPGPRPFAQAGAGQIEIALADTQ